MVGETPWLGVPRNPAGQHAPRNGRPCHQLLQAVCIPLHHGLRSLHGVRNDHHTAFNPAHGDATGAKATCRHCHHRFSILDAIAATKARLAFRLFGELVLIRDGAKEYLPATAKDQAAYQKCGTQLHDDARRQAISLATLALQNGYNTRQAMSYGFTACFKSRVQRKVAGLVASGSAFCGAKDRSAGAS
jgi:hypothetical protein